MARGSGAPQFVPGEQLGKFLAVGLTRIEIEQGHGRRADHYHARLGNRLGQHMGGKGIAEPGEAIVEGQVSERLQGKLQG
jgi:hypothetical protein